MWWVWVMPYIELIIIALLTLIQTFFLIFLFRGLNRALVTGLLELDSNLAAAIDKVMSGEMPNMEPINPMQAMLMNIIQEKMNTPKVIDRDLAGKFQ